MITRKTLLKNLGLGGLAALFAPVIAKAQDAPSSPVVMPKEIPVSSNPLAELKYSDGSFVFGIPHTVFNLPKSPSDH